MGAGASVVDVDVDDVEVVDDVVVVSAIVVVVVGATVVVVVVATVLVVVGGASFLPLLHADITTRAIAAPHANRLIGGA